MGTGDPKQAEMDDNPVIEITRANRNVSSQIKNINAQFGTRSRIFHKPALGHELRIESISAPLKVVVCRLRSIGIGWNAVREAQPGAGRFLPLTI